MHRSGIGYYTSTMNIDGGLNPTLFIPKSELSGSTGGAKRPVLHYRVGSRNGCGPFMALNGVWTHARMSKDLAYCSGGYEHEGWQRIYHSQYYYVSYGNPLYEEIYSPQRWSTDGVVLTQRTTTFTLSGVNAEGIDTYTYTTETVVSLHSSDDISWNSFKNDPHRLGQGSIQNRSENISLPSSYWVTVDIPEISEITVDTTHGEWNLWEGINIIGHPLERWALTGAETAYFNAVENIPEAKCNTIANIVETASTITSLLKGDLSKGGKVVEMAGESWLGYRYAYCTTKSDIKDYASLTERLCRLANSDSFRCFGTASYHGWDFCCSFDLNTAEAIPSTTLEWLQTYGFKLSAYNTWDMVPYSFIIDWFIHVGDFLEYIEGWGKAISLSPKNVWTSMTIQDGKFSTYIRFQGGHFGQIPRWELGKASKETIVKRITDTLSLIFVSRKE